MRRRSAFMMMGAAASLATTAPGPAASATPGLLIDGVSIVDTRDGAITRDRAIYIEGGRIVRIGAAGRLQAPAGTQPISAKGRFVTPGYLDMHAHPLEPVDAATSLPLMVSYGVTGYRQMAGSTKLLADKRARRLPAGLVPEMLETAGPVLAGPPTATDPAAAVAEVRRRKGEGADFIKLIDLRPPAYFAAIEEAHRLGMRASGHLPFSIGVREAAAHGIDSLEHLGRRPC